MVPYPTPLFRFCCIEQAQLQIVGTTRDNSLRKAHHHRRSLGNRISLHRTVSFEIQKQYSRHRTLLREHFFFLFRSLGRT